MLIEQTLEKLTAMKLGAMAAAVQQQLGSDEATALSFEDRLGVLVDTEWTAREQRKLTRRLRAAKLRYAASLEAVDFTHPRRLKRQQVVSLGSGAWIADRHNLLIIGPTGIGKSFLASAFVERACRQGFSARYVRMPRLLHEVAVGRGDGSYTRLLTRLAKLDLLAIDDWLLAPLRDAERRDLVEVIEDRAERASTLIASQLPVPDWHAVIGDPNQADAICDRLLHDAHRIELTGPSLRRTKTAPKTSTQGSRDSRGHPESLWILSAVWKTPPRLRRLVRLSLRFPHRFGRRARRPQGSTRRSHPRHQTHEHVRITKLEVRDNKPTLTHSRRFAPTSVHLRRNPRSRCAESAFNFTGIRTGDTRKCSWHRGWPNGSRSSLNTTRLSRSGSGSM